MPDLLVEVLMEEMPAGFQSNAEIAFCTALEQELHALHLPFERACSFSTPRRLAVLVHGVAQRQKDSVHQRKGPSVGAPKLAIEGFLRSTGLDIDQCEIRETSKGPAYYATIQKKGSLSKDILPHSIAKAITQIPWAHSMYFAYDTVRWVRPLHGIVATFGGEVLKGLLDLGGRKLPFTNTTVGHRFMTPGSIQVNSHTYEDRLAEAKVVLRRKERCQQIQDGLRSYAKTLGIFCIEDDKLLQDVVGLVEHPTVLVGKIDKMFMHLPREVLITSMRKHQKFFAFTDADGRLAPYFATVANIQAVDGGKAITAGNERVLRARLADSDFFWKNDLRTPLDCAVAKLEAVIFHAKLGSVAKRVERLQTLAVHLTALVGGNKRDVERAAYLCKADLVSGMVGEFPELQGIVGRYYAQEQGESARVCTAIAEHYMPRGAKDICPQAPESVALAMAEKVEMLTGFWSAGEKPTSSKDPYALRRCTLGILRLILENSLQCDLRAVITFAFSLHSTGGNATDSHMVDDLMHFFAERIKIYLKSSGIRHDYIEAVFCFGLNTIFSQVRLVKALSENSSAVSSIKSIHMRAKNIIGKGIDVPCATVDSKLFTEKEEQEVFSALVTTKEKVVRYLKNMQFTEAIAVTAHLQLVICQFFDAVMVNHSDTAVRNNRLALLGNIIAVLTMIADFEKIET